MHRYIQGIQSGSKYMSNCESSEKIRATQQPRHLDLSRHLIGWLLKLYSQVLAWKMHCGC